MAANQYFQMANAAKSVVVDASYLYEPQLIESYTKLDGIRLRLDHVDRKDDPYPHLPSEDRAIERLAEFMSHAIRPFAGARVHVEARGFVPETLPAVLRTAGDSASMQRAFDFLNDVDTPKDIRGPGRTIDKDFASGRFAVDH